MMQEKHHFWPIFLCRNMTKSQSQLWSYGSWEGIERTPKEKVFVLKQRLFALKRCKHDQQTQVNKV